MSTDFDVIVLGAGGAGLSAALAAAEQGARVLVCESDKKSGGTTALSTGVVYAAGTAVQRSKGMSDNADAISSYVMMLNAYRAQPSLVRVLSDNSAAATGCLTDLGVGFRTEDLYIPGIEAIPRVHRAERNGAEIAEMLDAAASRHNVVFAFNTRIEGKPTG